MKKKKIDNFIEKDNQKYLRIGNKVIPFDDFNKNGKPIIKPVTEKKKNKKGGIDVVIKIPCMIIKTELNN